MMITDHYHEKKVAGARKYFVHTKHQQQFFREKKHIVKSEEKCINKYYSGIKQSLRA